MENKRLTWKRCLDGYEDVGLRNGVTVGEAMCKLADYEATDAMGLNVRESIYPDGGMDTPECPRCGSGEYLTNEDGNKNCFCGQCGQALDWTEPEE